MIAVPLFPSPKSGGSFQSGIEPDRVVTYLGDESGKAIDAMARDPISGIVSEYGGEQVG